VAAKIHELDIEAADGGGRREHLGLKLLGAIPGRLAAQGGVEGENEPAPPLACLLRHRPGLGEKCSNLGRRRARFCGLLSAVGHAISLEVPVSTLTGFPP
jgi:hypothetical protein